MSKQIYYKIVSPADRGEKTFLPYIHPSIGIKYRVGRWAYPLKDSQIMAFSDLGYAKTFFQITSRHEGQIWECEVEKHEGACKFLLMGNGSTGHVLSFLALNKNSSCFLNQNCPGNAPHGTVFCSRIKLLKRADIS